MKKKNETNACRICHEETVPIKASKRHHEDGNYSYILPSALVKRRRLHEGLQRAFMTSVSPHVNKKPSWKPSKGFMKTGVFLWAFLDRNKNVH
jgi:hypothetical protein